MHKRFLLAIGLLFAANSWAGVGLHCEAVVPGDEHVCDLFTSDGDEFQSVNWSHTSEVYQLGESTSATVSSAGFKCLVNSGSATVFADYVLVSGEQGSKSSSLDCNEDDGGLLQ